MNRNQSDRDYGQHEGGFQTHRTERYRHPEQDSGYRSDDYGTSARGSYGNEGNRGSSRRNYTNINITDSDTYSTSRNYGNMGSYGGAQGFGDIRGGRHDSGHPFDSGTSSPGRERERGYNPRGYSSFGNESYDRGGDYGREQRSAGGRGQDDLYGQDTSSRFQGSSGQGRFNFERDDYYSSNYGDDQGNYMGSGYHRTTPGHYGTGDYGSAGYIEQNNPDRSRRAPREFNTAQNRWNTDW